ncbi:hypothetical protein AMTRI_Chr09g33210 [Amborella trichopoda]
MGFVSNWRSLIFGCLSMAHFSILIIGSPKGFFKASRGIRQGDPLSPFFFTLYAECFSKMIGNIVDKAYFTSFEVAQNGIRTTHLQYADDTLLFCDVNSAQVNNIKLFLICCEVLMGLKVNFGKTILIGVNYADELVQVLATKFWL